MGFTRTTGIVGGVGVFLIVLGVVFLVGMPKLFYALVLQRLPLMNGSETFKNWQDIPLPTYQRIYFFNVTNPDEFFHQGKKPVLEEVGPYTYKSHWVKENLIWYLNGTLSYREIRSYYFDAEKSSGTEDDNIITLNAPLVTTASMLKHVTNPFIKFAATVFLNNVNETLFVRKTVKELLYDGYEDILASLSHMIDPDLPVKDGKFGWLRGRNATDDGLYTVYSGETTMSKFNLIDKLNGKNKVNWWKKDSPCNLINGTNGELFPPLKENQKKLTVFVSEFCRSWDLDYKEDVVSYGMTLKRFVAPRSIFYNSTDLPENACYETNRQLASGAMDISPCQFGVPLVLSFPHFLYADPVYLSKVVGLQPNTSLHQFNLDVEAQLGLALGLKARIQLNLALERVSFLRYFSNITEMIFPVFWQEIDISQDQKIANQLRSLLEKPMFYIELISYCLLAIGGGLTVAMGVLFVLRKRHGTEKPEGTTPLIHETDQEEKEEGDDSNQQNGAHSTHNHSGASR